MCTKSVERVDDVEESEERVHDHCIHGGIEEKGDMKEEEVAA